MSNWIARNDEAYMIVIPKTQAIVKNAIATRNTESNCKAV